MNWLRFAKRPCASAACPFTAILADAAWRQAVMDRYEWRNLTRRKFAICAFDAGASAQGRVFIDID
jgi:hypothetical protein